MRRLLLALILLAGLNGAPLLAQHFSARVNGWGGFGINSTSTSYRWGDSSSRVLSADWGLDAGGYVYDPRLLNYEFSTAWSQAGSNADLIGSRSGSFTYGGSFSFLPERSFPFTIYFSRTSSDSSGDFSPGFLSFYHQFGVRGSYKKQWLGDVSYNFGNSSTETEVTGREFSSKQRFASVGLTRRLFGWDMNVSENYLRSSSPQANFRQRQNNLTWVASRSFRQRVHANLGAAYSNFAFEPNSGPSGSHSSGLLFSGRLSWNHTRKLDSFYGATIAHHAVNTVRVLNAVSGGSGLQLPFNNYSAKTTSESVAAGLTYRATRYLGFNGSASYSHSGLPKQVSSLTDPLQRQSIVTDTFNVAAGVSYSRKFGKLEFSNTDSVNWQQYRLLSGSPGRSAGYAANVSLGGGDQRKLRVDGGISFDRRWSPLFFNSANTTGLHVNLGLSTARLGFVTLRLAAEYGKYHLAFVVSDRDLDNKNFTLSAIFPRRNVSVYAAHFRSSFDERFFGPNSILFQSGGSTGSVPLSPQLLTPAVFSAVASDRLGLTWQPTTNLLIGSRYSRNRILFSFVGGPLDRYWDFQTDASYKFGRFTMVGGYARANTVSNQNEVVGQRLFFRVRFPFHVLGE